MTEIRKTWTRLFESAIVVISGTLLSGVTGGITGAVANVASGIMATDIFNLLISRGNPMLTLEQGLDFVECLSRQHRGEGMSTDEITIFPGLWEDKNFKEIASHTGKDRRLCENVAQDIYKFRSDVTAEKVTKKNLQSAIEQAYKRCQTAPGIEILVQNIRSQIKTTNRITDLYGKIKMPFMSDQIQVCDIYTDVLIWEKIPSRTSTSNQLNRLPALDAVKENKKLFVLGKPGIGKTTFLKQLLIRCIDIEGKFKDEFLPDFVPIFICLREFADAGKFDLLTYIQQEIKLDGVEDNHLTKVLSHGKAFLLFDGFDEVKTEKKERVINAINKFVKDYIQNRFVMTCRIAAEENFDNFEKDVEIADFTPEQIKEFVQKWFQGKPEHLIEKFHHKLERNDRSKELATNPLLLTLLCFVFEDNQELFDRRSQLYQKALNLLLQQWNKNIERNEIYQNLPLRHKEGLLSHIAYTNFVERGNLQFAQKIVQEDIAEYMKMKISQYASIEPDKLNSDSQEVLKGIEIQHGILNKRSAKDTYSFCHKTFQEYLTAKSITSAEERVLEENLQKLVEQIKDKQWRELFLLTVEMLPNADYLLRLMKQEVDDIVAGDEDIQECLEWVNKKVESIEHSYKPACVRDVYFEYILEGYLQHFFTEDRGLPYDLAIDLSLQKDLGLVLAPSPNISNKFKEFNYGLDRTIDKDFDRDYYFPFKPGQLEDRNEIFRYAKTRNRSEVLDVTLEKISALKLKKLKKLKEELEKLEELKEELEKLEELKEELEKLKKQIPSEIDAEISEEWWQDWAEELRKVMIKYRKIGKNWQFTDEQHERLKHYYNANLLLVECLNNCREFRRGISEIRQEIEDTLLLPIAEIEKRQKPIS